MSNSARSLLDNDFIVLSTLYMSIFFSPPFPASAIVRAEKQGRHRKKRLQASPPGHSHVQRRKGKEFLVWLQTLPSLGFFFPRGSMESSDSRASFCPTTWRTADTAPVISAENLESEIEMCINFVDAAEV